MYMKDVKFIGQGLKWLSVVAVLPVLLLAERIYHFGMELPVVYHEWSAANTSPINALSKLYRKGRTDTVRDR